MRSLLCRVIPRKFMTPDSRRSRRPGVGRRDTQRVSGVSWSVQPAQQWQTKPVDVGVDLMRSSSQRSTGRSLWKGNAFPAKSITPTKGPAASASRSTHLPTAQERSIRFVPGNQLAPARVDVFTSQRDSAYTMILLVRRSDHCQQSALMRRCAGRGREHVAVPAVHDHGGRGSQWTTRGRLMPCGQGGQGDNDRPPSSLGRRMR